MKNPIHWHKDCLRNLRISAEILREESRLIIARAERLERLNSEYEAQIDLAESRGLKEFDVDKLWKRRNEAK